MTYSWKHYSFILNLVACGALLLFPVLPEGVAQPADELDECRSSLNLAWKAMEQLESRNKVLQEAVAASEAEVSRLLAASQAKVPPGTVSGDAVKLQVEIKALQSKIDARDKLILDMKATLISQREHITKLENRIAQGSGEPASAARPAKPAEVPSVAPAKPAVPAPAPAVAKPEAPVGEKKPEPKPASKPEKPAVKPAAKPTAKPAAKEPTRQPPQKPAAEKSTPAPVAPKPEAAKPAPVPEMPAGNIGAMMAEGTRLLEQGDFAGAEQQFLGILKQAPHDVPARLGLANVYMTGGAIVESRTVLEEVLRDVPEQPDALGLAGLLAYKEGNLRQALKHLEKAIKVGPANAQLFNYLGMVHYADGKTSQAAKALDQAVTIDPNNAEAFFNLAVVLASGSKPDLGRARSAYEKALGLGSSEDPSLESLLYP